MAQADGQSSVLGADAWQTGLLTAEESSRADLYALCASLLLDSPDGPLLTSLAAAAPEYATPPGNSLHDALGKLAAAASIKAADVVRDEFDTLFTSIGTPVINPYASVYLAGFMNDKPLAHLHSDLAQLGLSRIAGRGEAEDHLGVLCEIMRVMIASERLRQPLSRQQQFFSTTSIPGTRCVCHRCAKPPARHSTVAPPNLFIPSSILKRKRSASIKPPGKPRRPCEYQ